MISAEKLSGENKDSPALNWTTRNTREMSEKCSPQMEGRRGFQYDLLFMYAKNEFGISLIIPLVALLIMSVMLFLAPSPYLWFWLASVLISKAVVFNYCRLFLKKPKIEIDVTAWKKKLMAAEFFYGICWAALVFVSAGSSNPSVNIFIFASVIVVIAMRMMIASTVLPIMIIGTIPMTVALIISALLNVDALHCALALMAVGVHVSFIFLAKGFNDTALEMLSYRAQKDSLRAEIKQVKDVSERTRSSAEIANMAKSRFLATMSHELRTPLNAILGFSEAMKSELFGRHKNPTYKEYASDIYESGKHLLNLINEILDLSRIEAGKYELNEEAIALVNIIDDCRRLIKLKMESKKISLTEQVDEKLARLWIDERAIRQVCLNLLSNAVKFTPTSGHIIITVGLTDDGRQFLSVEDNGPGIPQEEIPKVLSSFGQGALAYEMAEGGTGLGLPIVRGLMDIHGGTFDLQSQLGKGTIATVTFPHKRVVAPLAPLPSDEKQAKQVAMGSRIKSQQRPSFSEPEASPPPLIPPVQ